MRARLGVLRRIALDQELHLGGDLLVRGVRQHRLHGEFAAGFQRHFGREIHRQWNLCGFVAHVGHGDQLIDHDGRGARLLGEPHDIDVFQRKHGRVALAGVVAGGAELAAGKIAFDPFPTGPIGLYRIDEVLAIVVGNLESDFIHVGVGRQVDPQAQQLDLAADPLGNAEILRECGPLARAEKRIAIGPNLASMPCAGVATALSEYCPPGFTREPASSDESNSRCQAASDLAMALSRGTVSAGPAAQSSEFRNNADTAKRKLTMRCITKPRQVANLSYKAA